MIGSEVVEQMKAAREGGEEYVVVRVEFVDHGF